MKIFRVTADVNNYQYFMFEDSELGISESMKFDGESKAHKWNPPAVYINEPKLKKGNFYDLWSTTSIVVDDVALEHLLDLLEPVF